MRIVFCSIVVVGLLVLSSCGLKDQCEINHEGDICVENTTSNTVEVYVNDIYAFDLLPGLSNCINKPVGTYNVKFINLAEENILTVEVTECEETEVVVSF